MSGLRVYWLYFQLEQVDQAILAAGETDDLVTLRRDLDQLIKLSEGNCVKHFRA